MNGRSDRLWPELDPYQRHLRQLEIDSNDGYQRYSWHRHAPHSDPGLTFMRPHNDVFRWQVPPRPRNEPITTPRYPWCWSRQPPRGYWTEDTRRAHQDTFLTRSRYERDDYDRSTGAIPGQPPEMARPSQQQQELEEERQVAENERRHPCILGNYHNHERPVEEAIRRFREVAGPHMETLQHNATDGQDGVSKLLVDLFEAETPILKQRVRGEYCWSPMEDPLLVSRWASDRGYTRDWSDDQKRAFRGILNQMHSRVQRSRKRPRFTAFNTVESANRIGRILADLLRNSEITNIGAGHRGSPFGHIYEFYPTGPDTPRYRRRDFDSLERLRIDRQFGPSVWIPDEDPEEESRSGWDTETGSEPEWDLEEDFETVEEGMDALELNPDGEAPDHPPGLPDFFAPSEGEGLLIFDIDEAEIELAEERDKNWMHAVCWFTDKCWEDPNLTFLSNYISINERRPPEWYTVDNTNPRPLQFRRRTGSPPMLQEIDMGSFVIR